MTQPYDDKLWKIAQKRVSFRRHLMVYILVNIALIVIWYLSRDPEKAKSVTTYWFLYPLCGWGIGLVLHYWNAYHDDDSSVEKEFNRLKKLKDDKINEEVKSELNPGNKDQQ